MEEHLVDRQAWLAAGKQAIIGHLIPEQFGGARDVRTSVSAAW